MLCTEEKKAGCRVRPVPWGEAPMISQELSGARSADTGVSYTPCACLPERVDRAVLAIEEIERAYVTPEVLHAGNL